MEKLIKYHMYVQYHKKHPKKKLYQATIIQSTVFLWMMAFKTLLHLIGRFKWIWKMMHTMPSNKAWLTPWLCLFGCLFFSCFLLICLLFYKGKHMWYPTLTGVTIWQVSFQWAFKIVKHYLKCFLIKKNTIIALTLTKQFKSLKSTHLKPSNHLSSCKNNFHNYVIADILPRYGSSWFGISWLKLHFRLAMFQNVFWQERLCYW